MDYPQLVSTIADILKEYDSETPIHKNFRPGIGPFGEPQIVKEISTRLAKIGITAITKRTPDLAVNSEWAIEFKIVRPFGDNGREAENWSVNLLHPYEGNVSLIGDAIKLSRLSDYRRKGLFVIGYEHNPSKIDLNPLLASFEVVMREIVGIKIGKRIEEVRPFLIHPEHQILRCIGWEI